METKGTTKIWSGKDENGLVFVPVERRVRGGAQNARKRRTSVSLYIEDDAFGLTKAWNIIPGGRIQT